MSTALGRSLTWPPEEQAALRKHAEATQELRRLGLVKSNRHALTGDLAECIACRALGLTPAPSKANPGFEPRPPFRRPPEARG